MPLSLVALSRVCGEDSGVASSLLNTGQQVGGAIGLAALGTVTWTAVAGNIKHQFSQAAAAAARAAHQLPTPKPGATPPAAVLNHALTVGISRGFLVAAGIALLALVITIATIRVRREDLSGTQSTIELPANGERSLPGAREREGVSVGGDGLAGAEEPVSS